MGGQGRSNMTGKQTERKKRLKKRTLMGRLREYYMGYNECNVFHYC